MAGADVRNPGRATSPMLVVPVAVLVLLALALLIWPQLLLGASVGDFLLVSLFLGGGAAWLTGKAIARGWGPYAHLVVYCLLLAGAVRFCHFALFEDTLFSPQNFAIEFVFLVAVATLGMRAVRRRQMTVQYGWLYEPAGALAWRGRAAPPAGAATP